MTDKQRIKEMQREQSQRMLDFLGRMTEVVEDFYDVYDEQQKTPAGRRYMFRKEGQINGMCEAFELLTGTRIEWGREGVHLANTKEV